MDTGFWLVECLKWNDYQAQLLHLDQGCYCVIAFVVFSPQEAARRSTDIAIISSYPELPAWIDVTPTSVLSAQEEMKLH